MSDCIKCCITSCLAGMILGGYLVISNKNIANLFKQGKEFATEKVEELKETATEKLQEAKQNSKNNESK